MIAEVLHIAPWDQRDRLTADELATAQAYIDQIKEAERVAAEKAKARR